MGAISTKSTLRNHSKRSIRVFISDTALERDAFVVADKVDKVDKVAGEGAAEDQKPPPGDGAPKFRFRKDVRCVRVLPDQCHELPWELNQFLSVFVEDKDEQEVFSKQIVASLAVPSPVVIFLYDV